METATKDLRKLLDEPEGSNLEFKQARNRFGFDELAEYCVAIANVGGGKIVLGVTDKRPREIVGTNAFSEPGETEASLFEELEHRVRIEEHRLEGKRVLIVHIPGRGLGDLWMVDGKALKREGDSLVPMAASDIRRIFLSENPPDFSEQLCDATIADLSPEAIADFQQRWADTSGNSHITNFSHEQILRDAGLTDNGKLRYAALILFGIRETFRRYLPHVETFFEYRSSPALGPAQDRIDFCEGLFLYHDKIWEKVNQRNDQQNYQDKLFKHSIPTFDEDNVRESLLNAVAHREYHDRGAIHIRQFQRHIEIDSPGGFLVGVTPDNVIDKCSRRNPLLAECFHRAGLVERAGHGIDAMIRTAVRHGKPLPDFSRSTDGDVCLTLDGTLETPILVLLMYYMDPETVVGLSPHSLMTLHAIANKQPLNGLTRTGLPDLLDADIVERHGKGRGTYYAITRARYTEMGLAHRYENQLKPDKEEYKPALLQYIREFGAKGAHTSDLMKMFPELSRDQLWTLLRPLRDEGLIHSKGSARATRWVASD